MFFPLDPQSGVPFYEQVVQRIYCAVASEVLRPGDMVPSVRQLAGQLELNPNTVARAYRTLRQDQILQAVRGRGLAVTKAAPEKCVERRSGWIRSRCGQVLREAILGGISHQALRELVESEMLNLRVPRPGGETS